MPGPPPYCPNPFYLLLCTPDPNVCAPNVSLVVFLAGKPSGLWSRLGCVEGEPGAQL